VDLPTVIESELKEDQVFLNIISNGTGLLIGKRGKTLGALQHLVAKILHREVGENVSVIVDTENYRSKRETSLTELAQQLSEKVKKSHRSLTTGPMNAQDRRIIHLALKEDLEVRTKSKGEGNLRRVVIYPIRRGKKPQPVAALEE
jgi:spoIIIJ-associated protein